MVRLLLLAGLLVITSCRKEQSSADMSLQGGTIICEKASDCPQNLPMCHPDARVCVGCIASFRTCGAGLMCDEATHTCIPAEPNAPCKRNQDCPRAGIDPTTYFVCDVPSGQCRECLTDNDCVAPEACYLASQLCCENCLPGKCAADSRPCSSIVDAGATD